MSLFTGDDAVFIPPVEWESNVPWILCISGFWAAYFATPIFVVHLPQTRTHPVLLLTSIELRRWLTSDSWQCRAALVYTWPMGHTQGAQAGSQGMSTGDATKSQGVDRIQEE